MSNNDNITHYQTAVAWADIVLERWERKILTLKVIDTGELLNSLMHQVETDSNGNPNKIVFAFLYYGIFPDMGVGKGTTLEQRDDSTRKRKQWYSKQLWREVRTLGTIIAEKYGERAANAVNLFEARSKREKLKRGTI